MNKKKLLIITMICFILFLGVVQSSDIYRSFSSTTVAPKEDLNVTLTVDITKGETFYAIDELVPEGWAVKDAGTGSVDHAGHIKWLVIQDAENTLYNYILTAPSIEEQTTFEGTCIFEGGNLKQIVGQSQVSVSNKIPPVTNISRIFEEDFYREGEGIYINTVASPRTIESQDIKIQWGYDQEIIEIPYKEAKMPFWIIHDLSYNPDPCKGSLEFVTDYPTGTEFLWDYNVMLPNYSYDSNSARCEEPEDKESCWIYEEEFGENVLQQCDLGLVGDVCTWNQRFFNGSYTPLPRSRWRNIDTLVSCELMPLKKYWFRHSASIPVGSRIVFDVNAVFSLPVLGEFVFIIPEPEWISTASADYNTGTGFDFNWTKVTSDGNVMPTGSDRVYVEQNQAFYDQNLVTYWRFDDLNSDGSGVLDDTNNGNNGALLAGADIDALGMWDTNAINLDTTTSSVIFESSGTGIDMGTENSLVVWLYQTDDGLGIVVGHKAYNVGGYMLFVDDTDIYYSNDSTAYVSVSHTAILNKWTHMSVSRSGTSVTFYVNGVQKGATQTLSNNKVVYVSTIGCYYACTSNYSYAGKLDELKIYNRTLTADEILQDYNSWMNSSYDSPIFDSADAGTEWNTIIWDEITDVNNSITVDYRGCTASDCSSAGDWQTGLSGGGATKDISNADGNRYFQYRVNFDTNKANWNTLRDSDTDKGDFGKFSDVTVTYTLPSGDSCSCPVSGHWEIISGDICTLSNECTLTGSLHISSGSLNITSTGTLAILSGQKITIKEGNNLYIENGGKYTIDK